MQKLFHLPIALLLFFVDFVHAEHHHEDHKIHTDCSLCIIQYTPVDNKIQKLDLKLSPLYPHIEKPQKPIQPKEKLLVKSTYNRAPPVV
ncbi:MAG: hypothetical protein P3W89_003175 [Aquificaceae bacterium]|nr:hypothetical protein [Aquificaceae bacterium]